MAMEQEKQAYAAAGVDIDAAGKALDLIKKHVRSTLRPEVLSNIGTFGGLFQLSGFSEPVLVSSADGVGTKIQIAAALERYDTIGIDLVNHCVNDIFTCGADPLFFLDYIAVGKLVPDQVGELVKGLAKACSDAGCALIGGETAEMPGLYASGDYDLVGFIVGAVEKSNIIDGRSIAVGDRIIGLPSSGPHTNGYSLIRKIFGNDRAHLEASYPQLGDSLGNVLLEPHICYYRELKPHLPLIKGMAHITGGGLLDNIPRILHSDMSAQIKKGSWDIPPIFSLIQKKGNIDEKEMFRVFNMGIGMAVFCSAADANVLLTALPEAVGIGEIIAGNGQVLLR